MRFGQGAQFGRATSGAVPLPPPPPPDPLFYANAYAGFAAGTTANNVTIASAGVAGPSGSGIADATRMTATGTGGAAGISWDGPAGGLRIVARVKQDTADRCFLHIDYAPSSWGYQSVFFDLTTMTKEYDFWAYGIDPLGVAGTITDLGGGWAQIAVKGTGEAGIATLGLVANSAGDNPVAGQAILVADFAVYAHP